VFAFFFRLFYRDRFEVFVSDLQRVAAIATMTKTANGNMLAEQQDPGSWMITDMFLVVCGMGDARLGRNWTG
jgi:hypothetical protein